MNLFEVYKLVCACGETVEIPAGPANTPERLPCPRCGVELDIDWRAAGPLFRSRKGGPHEER